MINGQKSDTCCPRCGADHLDKKPAPLPHHQKLICGSCGQFIRWLPKPETAQKQARLLATLERLIKQPLVGWDGIFVRDLYRRSRRRSLHLTQKQIDQLTRIVHIYLQKGENRNGKN